MPAYRPDGSPDLAAALGALPTGTPVSEVARRMLDLFTSGEVAPGTRLPPERQLSATLGVGRSAVREALAALEILGIVDVRAGSGTGVVVAGGRGERDCLSARVVARRPFAGYWEYFLEEALFTAPAHPRWGGAACIGPDGRLVKGWLAVQVEGHADAVAAAIEADRKSRPLEVRADA